MLQIRNEHRYEMYDPQIEFADPLIPRELTFGIAERMLADGTVLRGAGREARSRRWPRSSRPRAWSRSPICLLNSYANPANERAVGKQLAALLPDVYLSLSSDVAPQIREYPRASTTAVNAYTMPITQPYLRGLSERPASAKAFRTRR